MAKYFTLIFKKIKNPFRKEIDNLNKRQFTVFLVKKTYYVTFTISIDLFLITLPYPSKQWIHQLKTSGVFFFQEM